MQSLMNLKMQLFLFFYFSIHMIMAFLHYFGPDLNVSTVFTVHRLQLHLVQTFMASRERVTYPAAPPVSQIFYLFYM